MAKTLLTKLTLVLVGVMLIVGTFTVAMTGWINRSYLAEIQQRIHLDVPSRILAEEILLRDGEIDQDGLKHVFQMMMVIHPSIELYLTDPTGGLLAFSAPEGKVVSDRISLAPVEALLAGGRLPILGDDPRDPAHRKPFAAAQIHDGDQLQGYLYIIVGGEPYANTIAMLSGSYATRLGIGVLLLGLTVAAGAGFIMFRWITGRVRTLHDEMRQFEDAEFRRGPVAPPAQEGDELDVLRSAFHRVSGRVTQLLEQRESVDTQRRELIANISHDLRTPLAAMRGYLETLSLKDGSLDPAERQRYLTIAEQHGARLQRLIDDLFDLSKLDSGQTKIRREPFSMAELVQDVVQKFELTADRGRVDLRTELAPASPLVDADVGLIERVLDNLLDNAIKYTGEGGTIRVSVQSEARGVRVAISDSGRGIPQDDLPRIFDRFYRSGSGNAQDREGSGLGLAIAARILDLHASTIDAESEEGRGTTFSFRLPSFQPATI